MASRPYIGGGVLEIRASGDEGREEFEITVCLDTGSELTLAADRDAARRFRVGDRVTVVAYKTSARSDA